MSFAKLMAIILVLCPAAGAQAPKESVAAHEVTGMLRQFLDDAASGNRAGFEKFFAEDVIYTRSVGVVNTKADIMKGVDSLKPTAESKTTFSAEDITVHDYSDMEVVAFRLVSRTEHSDGKVETGHYRNTGVFLRRNGRWQVVAWQATKIPEDGEKQ